MILVFLLYTLSLCFFTRSSCFSCPDLNQDIFIIKFPVYFELFIVSSTYQLFDLELLRSIVLFFLNKGKSILSLITKTSAIT
jgi:hypothetical protein